jgi:hypothetical protein
VQRKPEKEIDDVKKDGEDEGICIYVANITVYADKAKNFVRTKLIKRCARLREEQPAEEIQKKSDASEHQDVIVRKASSGQLNNTKRHAVIAVFQETHCTKEQADKEADELFRSGWKSAWVAGEPNDQMTGLLAERALFPQV